MRLINRGESGRAGRGDGNLSPSSDRERYKGFIIFSDSVYTVCKREYLFQVALRQFAVDAYLGRKTRRRSKKM